LLKPKFKFKIAGCTYLYLKSLHWPYQQTFFYLVFLIITVNENCYFFCRKLDTPLLHLAHHKLFSRTSNNSQFNRLMFYYQFCILSLPSFTYNLISLVILGSKLRLKISSLISPSFEILLICTFRYLFAESVIVKHVHVYRLFGYRQYG
jgi:hypothetical protein